MDSSHEEVTSLTLSKTFKFQKAETAETGITKLIEAAEMLRANKIDSNLSFSDAFFSNVKQYIR